VSNPAGRSARPEREVVAAFGALETSVGRALDRLQRLGDRLLDAEEKNEELEEVVRRFTGDQAESARVLTRLEELERENSDLKSRLEEGRAGVDRLLAKIRFLENQS
jgi:predicted RNase H-like nuclease (RuvC/YqgF family)